MKIILDSGLYFDYPSFETGNHDYKNRLMNIYNLANVDSPSPSEPCNNIYGSDSWKCFLLTLSYPFFFKPKLFINSNYDNLAIQNVLNIDCLNK